MTPPRWSAHRRRVADALVLLLLISPLLSVTAGNKNRGKRDVDQILKPHSLLFIEEKLHALYSQHHPRLAKKENVATSIYSSEETSLHRKNELANKQYLLVLNILNHNNENNYKSRRNIDFHKQASPPTGQERLMKNRIFQQNPPVSFPFYKQNLNKKHPNLLDGSNSKPLKKEFKPNRRVSLSNKITKKKIILYNTKVNTKDKTFPKSDANVVQFLYPNSELNVQKKIKRSVIRLSGTETVGTIDCVNKSSINSTCGTDSRFNFVPGSEDISRTSSNDQYNNHSTDRNRKVLKGISSLSLSRLTFPVQKKKAFDITDGNMGHRTPSTSEPFQKLWLTLGGANNITMPTNKTVNVPFMVPSVKPAGRLTATNIAPEGLDAASITGITVGSVVFLGLIGAMCFILYKRRNQNKPQTLSDKSSNPDSSVYIEESSDDSEEMYSLDNDSFLNSLEAMTIQNYWTENVKHTKL